MADHFPDEDGICRECGVDVISALEAENVQLRAALQAMVDSTGRGAIPPRLAVVQHAESLLGLDRETERAP